jgi:predicted GNAT family acetyltransferase
LGSVNTPHAAQLLAGAVRDRPEMQRYELAVEGTLAFIDYRKNGGEIALLYAEVPAQLSGQGIGTALVDGAVRLARAQNLRVQPVCPFIVAVMRRHPEW